MSKKQQNQSGLDQKGTPRIIWFDPLLKAVLIANLDN